MKSHPNDTTPNAFDVGNMSAILNQETHHGLSSTLVRQMIQHGFIPDDYGLRATSVIARWTTKQLTPQSIDTWQPPTHHHPQATKARMSVPQLLDAMQDT
eukprot:1440350-Amphidinium_carterae.1